MASDPRPFTHVAVLVFDNCMTSAVAGLIDAFQIANRWFTYASAGTPPFKTTLLGSTTMVAGSSGFVFATEPLDANRPLDVAIVPPIWRDIPETVAVNPAIVSWLARYAESGGIVASVCAGSFFLAAAGLLAGRPATTNPMFAPAFRRAYPDTKLLLERRLVDDGRILTAGSTTAFLDLAIYLIERFAGRETAIATAKALSIDKNRRSQLPYFLSFAEKDHGDSVVAMLQQWLEDHFVESVTAGQLARRGALSRRSINRRFVTATGLTPIAYLHRLRIEAAKRFLETSDLGIQEITLRVGYQDARSFARLFRACAGVSPGGYRRRFGAEESQRIAEEAKRRGTVSDGDAVAALRGEREDLP